MGCMYVIGSVPNLEFDSKPDISAEELYLLLKMNLSKTDLAPIKVLKRWVDLANLYKIFEKHDYFDKRGNYPQGMLKEFIETQQQLPSYVFEYLDEFESDEDRKKYFAKLIAKYFKEERKKAKGALAEFLKFENEWRILLTAYRAKKSEKSIAEILKYEDLSDPIVQISIAQSEAPGPFVFPFEYEELEAELKNAGPNPTSQMRALAKYRFNYYRDMGVDFPFTLRQIMAYLMQLFQLEDLFALDEIEGKKQLEKLMENENAS